MGGKSKPIIGIPIYDEHTNNIKWAEKKNLGVLAIKTSQVVQGIAKIKENYDEFESGYSSVVAVHDILSSRYKLQC